MKKCKTRAGYFGTIRDSLKRAAIGTSFDVSWSLVAQAVPENELFLYKMSIFRNRYLEALSVMLYRYHV